MRAALLCPSPTCRAASPAADARGSGCHAADAKRAWLQAALEDGLPVREPDNLENYSGQFELRIPKSLHRSLAEHARQEGISMNQYCV